MSKKQKVVIYGGTFSPPHIGHINVARSILESENPDRLLIIPTYISPHKEMGTDATVDQRLEMCKLAFAGLKEVEISDIEIKREGKSYTYLTLSELWRKDTELVLVCGTDMILCLDDWYKFEDIFKLATVAYVRRENDAEITNKILKKTQEYKQKYNARIREIAIDTIEISSTEIRNCIATGKDVSKYIPTAVKDYIDRWKIYCK